jgi:hypothetical protein
MPVAITVTPPMGGEDFLFTLNAEQGSYIMLRGGRAKDDAWSTICATLGASYWATLTEQLLPRKAQRNQAHRALARRRSYACASRVLGNSMAK